MRVDQATKRPLLLTKICPICFNIMNLEAVGVNSVVESVLKNKNNLIYFCSSCSYCETRDKEENPMLKQMWRFKRK